MIRSAASLGALCFCLIGCGARPLDLGHAAPASSAPTGATDPIVSDLKIGDLWLDAERTYWTALDGTLTLKSCRTEDCEHTKLSYAKDLSLVTVAFAEGRVFWKTGSSLFSCPTEGCEGDPTLVTVDSATWAREIHGYRDYVYWASDFDLYRCPALGCGETPEIVASNVHSPYLAFDEERVYWSDDLGIMSAPSDGSDQPQRVAESRMAKSLAIGDGYLYWATETQVFRCPIANCAAETTLLVDKEVATGLKVDDSAIYWLGYKEIYSCPLTGCEQPIVLVQSVPQLIAVNDPAAFAIDEGYLYWIESDGLRSSSGKSIRRMAK